jgi:hypothetical protein
LGFEYDPYAKLREIERIVANRIRANLFYQGSSGWNFIFSILGMYGLSSKIPGGTPLPLWFFRKTGITGKFIGVESR